MKIIIIGGTGTIGQAVAKALAQHEIVSVGSKSGDLTCDITSTSSIEKMYQQAGNFDAVICTTGKYHLEPFTRMTDEHYRFGLNSKLMGQVNLVLMGHRYINPKGSFTLTTGVLGDDPIPEATSACMINHALIGFAKSVAYELPPGQRINIVSPALVEESAGQVGNHFKGYETVPVSRVALAYVKCVEGIMTGKVYRVGYCC